MNQIQPVILCGGSGTRLWPRSRAVRPKPFLPLLGARSLFESTLDRCGDTGIFAPAMVVAGAAHTDLIAEQGGPAIRQIVEPVGRNTAPAIALAAARLPEDVVMLICPSDHYIADTASFAAAVQSAASLARDDWMVSLGITPDHPETGYGYIRQGSPLSGGFKVERFVEKPDLPRAQAFLEEGGYFWNGGIFAFRAGAFLDELTRHRPAMAEAAGLAVANGREEGSGFYPDEAAFAAIEGDSVDYAVMEQTPRAAVVPVDMGWSDIGNWQALADARDKDGAGNHIRGTAQLVDCRNVMVDSDGPRVSVIGMDDIVVVVDGDEILVTSRAGAQKVGKLDGAQLQ
ncbi:MAG: mannose-1-phosphate guanylyltransferase [Sphingomonadaceae bacterium]